jgi:transcriptional regulator with XRE-family HTH domain
MKRQQDRKLSNLAKAAELYLRGLTFVQIAEQLDITRQTASEYLKEAREIWKDRASAAITAHLYEAIAKLDSVEIAAWDGWDRSMRDAVQTTTEDIDRPDSAETKLKIVRVPQAGNPAFLKIIADTIRQRCELLGLLDPEIRESLNQEDYDQVVSVVIETRDEAAALRPMTFDEFEEAKRRGQLRETPAIEDQR